MGTGHMLFFYDKLKYLVKRQIDIIDEMRKRGMSPNFDALGLVEMNKDKSLFNDWKPELRDMRINLARLVGS
jgi:deoxyribonuclease (pyrimidine dimer)